MSTITTIPQLRQQIIQIFNRSFLSQLARVTGLIKRQRQLTAYQLVRTMLQVLGTRSNVNLADIHRAFCSNSGMDIAYKPFHNQLKKKAMTDFFEQLVSKALAQWLNHSACTLPAHYPFKRIELHDGSSLKLHNKLASEYPGRFTATHPAAVELHVTMDLLNGHINYLQIVPDKESERLYQPFANELKDTLVLEDAGYFDIGYCHDIDKEGGFYIIRTNNAINPDIIDSFDEQGRPVKGLSGKRLTSLKMQTHQIMDLTVAWAKRPGTYRLIAFWDKRKSRVGYMITNLNRSEFSATQILELYSLRWQIELLFKEWKSYSHLKTIGTAQPHLIKTLIWASVLTALLKRFVTYSVMGIFQVVLSTQKVARSASDWLPTLLKDMFTDCTATADSSLAEAAHYLTHHAQRANMKRDKKTPLFKLGCHPAMNF